MTRFARALLEWFAVAALCSGCASIPKGRYGVKRIEWTGVQRMSDEAVAACLATKPRERVELRLGLGSSQCGDPPFDSGAPRLGLFSWPWAAWPIYDPAIFAIDRERIVRFYQARGFYSARVLSVHYFADGNQIAESSRCEGDECALTLRIDLDEGPFVRVERVELTSDAALPPELLERLRRELGLRIGARLDEREYEADKTHLQTELREQGYAHASIEGRLAVDRDRGVARVVYRLRPGPLCRFGTVRVEGNGELDARVILDTARIRPGTRYRESTISDAEQAVYALAAFSSVRIESEAQAESADIPLVIRVRPGRIQGLRLGVGLMSGSLRQGTTDEITSVPEWDVHLRALYRNQNFLGGLRRLKLEDRPRLIMLDDFPGVPAGSPKLGNLLSFELEQPSFIESRTAAFVRASWDFGPDPFYGYFRHDVSSRLGLRRPWFGRRLSLELALGHDYYEITSRTHPDTVSSYRLPFLAQDARLDLRDDTRRPHRGFYLATGLQEALRLPGYGSWDYIRVLPEARAYQRLPWKLVLAERFAVGALFVLDRTAGLDPTSSSLGPESYRLRGGGANSNRGFLPGTLGAGRDGGKRRWEATVELRVPISHELELGLFVDGGDVNRGGRVRFERLNTAAGFGFRYFTAFVPIRLDLGWRIPALETTHGQDSHVPLGVLPSAAHLTIGEPL